MQHLLNKLFSFHDLNATVYIELLNSAYDLTECLLNCSQSSMCYYDFIKNKFICASASTQKETSPCLTNRCLNNATCADSLNGMYSCKCDEHYEGRYCELKKDVCLQNTCSSHSKCVDVNHRPKCKCFYLYEGEVCDQHSSELRIKKAVASTCLAVAIVIIIVTYVVFFLFDISTFLMRNKKAIRGKRKKNRKSKRKTRTKHQNKIKRLINESFV